MAASISGANYEAHFSSGSPEIGRGKSVAGARDIKQGNLPVTHPDTAMPTSPSYDPMSIFVDGKLKPGAYKVQNLYSQTYLEVLESSKTLCCRPATVLTDQDAVVSPT